MAWKKAAGGNAASGSSCDQRGTASGQRAERAGSQCARPDERTGSECHRYRDKSAEPFAGRQNRSNARNPFDV